MVSLSSYKNSMPDNIILFLFLGLFLGIIGWILFVILGKYLKGKIDISLPKRAYNFGEKIRGSFKLYAKKDIECENLTVHLVWYKRVSEYWKDWKKHTRREILARFSQDIDSNIKFIAGERKQYDISIQIPTYDNIFWKQQDIDLWDSTLWKLASYALNNTKRNQLTWQVQVDLEATWLDIYGKKDVFVTQ